MDFNEYQERIKETDLGTGERHKISPVWLYYVLGLGGETGELLEKIKKHFRDDYGIMTEQKLEEITKEMGDILWYMARLADFLGIPFDDVATTNISKLLDRKKRNKLKGSGDNR